MADKWDVLNREILAKLDIREEYAAVGIKLRSRSTASGWTEVEGNSSAAVNLAADGARGRYRDLGGAGDNLSFWDAMIAFGGHGDFSSCRKHYADKVGVKVGRGANPKKTGDLIKFQPWNDGLAAAWCRHKQGVTPGGARRCGAELGSYPAKGKNPQPVIAVPVFGPQLTDADPVGWVAIHRGGRSLPVFQGKGVPPKQVKILTVKGGTRGWIGRWALLHLESAERVYKLEGVPDVLALQGLIPEELRDKHVVLTNSAGTGEMPQDELIEHLSGKEVVVIHDRDNPGQGVMVEGQDRHRVSGSKLWCQEIARFAKSVKNVQLPFPMEEKHGKDLRDWINDGHSYAELLELVERTEEYKPKEPVPVDLPLDGKPVESEPPVGDGLPGDPHLVVERQICEALQIDVMGEIENGKIKMFSIWHRKMEVIRDVSRWTYEKILQFCGPPAKEVINKTDEWIPGQYSVQQIREAVALLAGYARLGKEAHEVGLGVWRGRSMDGNENETVVIVGSKEAARLNGEATLKRVLAPRVDGLLLDIGCDETAWYEFEQVSKYVSMAHTDQKWVQDTIAESVAVFRRWEWRTDVCPEIVTGLIMASWVQSLWRWRPLVALIGASKSGKSTLFATLGGSDSQQGIFGSLAVVSSKSSEAGIRQSIRNTAGILLLDEFEASKERAKIMELFRASGRGSKVLRGNTSQKGESYGLRHIPWVAAIEVGMDREPDRNRFIQLELLPPKEENRGKLDPPDEKVSVDLGQRLLAIALASVRTAVPLAMQLKSIKIPEIDSRVVESYAVPAAIMAAAHGVTDLERAEAFLRDLLRNVATEEQGRDDSSDLLEDILSAHVDCGRGVRLSVSQIIGSSMQYCDNLESIENHGVALVTDRLGRGGRGRADDSDGTEKFVFINHRVAKQKLLRGTTWESQSIDQILKRMPGAVYKRHYIAGKQTYGVRFPFDAIEKKYLDYEGDEGEELAVGGKDSGGGDFEF